MIGEGGMCVMTMLAHVARWLCDQGRRDVCDDYACPRG